MIAYRLWSFPFVVMRLFQKYNVVMLCALYCILELFRETEFIGLYVFMCMFICMSIWIIGVVSDTYGSSDVQNLSVL